MTRRGVDARLPGTRDRVAKSAERVRQSPPPTVFAWSLSARRASGGEQMTQRTLRSPVIAIVAISAIIFAACGGAASAAAHRRHRRSPDGRADRGRPVRGHGLSDDRRCPLWRRAVHRQLQEGHRGRPPDRQVRALRSGRGLPLEGRLQRLRHPGFRLPDGPHGRQVDPRSAERHRAVPARHLGQGQPPRPQGVRRLLGHQGHDRGPRIPMERSGRPAVARTPVRQRRWHRQPRHR